MIATPRLVTFARGRAERLPCFCSIYVDGGAGAETTLRRNEADLEALAIRRRVLREVEDVDLSRTLFRTVAAADVSAGWIDGHVGASRRSASRARGSGSKHTLLPLHGLGLRTGRVVAASSRPIWFQLWRHLGPRL